MTRMKKLASILLALVMVMAVATASAATVNNETNRPYSAYQIFSGTQSGEDSNILGDISWGSGVNTETLIPAFVGTDFAGCTTAAEVADKLTDDEGDNQAQAEAFANLLVNHLKGTGTPIAADAASVELDDGYYLLIDTSEEPETEEDYARNAALLQVTKSITITKKYDVPEVKKEVNDNDANIGDTVTFTLTGSMPGDLTGYDTYTVTFHDTLSKGLTYTNNLAVTIDGNDISSDNYTVSNVVTDNGAGTTYTLLTISFEDVLALGAEEKSEIVVTYTAVLNDDAIIGPRGNDNKVYLEYSNDPNADGTGKTPEKEVDVYTWELPISKVDNQGNVLPGAVFALFTNADCTEALNLVYIGKYKDQVPYYNVCKLDDCDHTHIEDNQIETDETGKFQINGLEKGTYYLKEIKAPDGYNTLEDALAITIGENGQLTYDGADEPIEFDSASVIVVNQSGATLPETGGIGTTILYVAGGLLIAAALVVLLAKRRTAA